MRVFEGIETDFVNINERWINTFDSILLSYDIRDWEDVEIVIDHLIDM